MFSLERRLEIPGWGPAGTIDTSHIKQTHGVWVGGETGTRKEAALQQSSSLLEENPGADHPKVLHMCSRAEQTGGCTGGGSLGLAVREANASRPGEAVSPSWEMGEGYPPNLRWCEPHAQSCVHTES